MQSARSNRKLSDMMKEFDAANELDIDVTSTNYRTADLNKLSDAELKIHKAAMDIDFHKNALKKGDPGF